MEEKERVSLGMIEANQHTAYKCTTVKSSAAKNSDFVLILGFLSMKIA